MSTPSGGRRGVAGLRVLGFPVTVDLSFVVIMVLIGYVPGISWRQMLLWLVIAPLSVLAHELGHAVLARAAGAHPQISLAGFGGVTSYVPPRPLSRGRSLAISLAGPLVGLVIGALLVVVQELRGDGALEIRGGWLDLAIGIGIWTSIGWSLLNLLPVLPLDGGQAMRELLPGDPPTRARRASAVSVVTATVAGLVAVLWLNQVFLGLFLGFFLVSNLMALRQGEERAQPAAPEQVVVELLWRGRVDRAREVMEALPPGTTADLAVHGAVLALSGDRDQGHALLDQVVRGRPTDPGPAALLLLTVALEHDWDAVMRVLQGPLASLLPPVVVERAAVEARGVGREDVANRITVLAQQRPD